MTAVGQSVGTYFISGTADTVYSALLCRSGERKNRRARPAQHTGTGTGLNVNGAYFLLFHAFLRQVVQTVFLAVIVVVMIICWERNALTGKGCRSVGR